VADDLATQMEALRIRQTHVNTRIAAHQSSLTAVEEVETRTNDLVERRGPHLTSLLTDLRHIFTSNE
jgi:hypothetical protein